MSGMVESFSNPSQREQIEERMAQLKQDPSLKPMMDEIESGGMEAMMRCTFYFWYFNYRVKRLVIKSK